MNFPARISHTDIILEQRTHQHDEALWQAILQNKEFIGQYLPWAHKMHQRTDVTTATDKFMSHWAKQDKFAYCIMEKTTHDLLGMIDLQQIDDTLKTAEIGYWLRQDKTGHGYIATALKLLETQAIKCGIRELRIRCDAHNRASIAVAQRADYILETVHHDAITIGTEHHNREIYLKKLA